MEHRLIQGEYSWTFEHTQCTFRYFTQMTWGCKVLFCNGLQNISLKYRWHTAYYSEDTFAAHLRVV